jgi:TonB-dependent receptor
MQIRAAATRGLSRPNYTNLVPFRSVDDDAREISRGNPDLDPSFAQNYDLMFERYGDRLGFFSVGVFAKFFRDAIVNEGVRETINGQEFIVFRPVNGGQADLFGFEVATTQSLGKLGLSSLRSFGIDANYTYNYSEADFGDRRDNFPLVRSPSHVANVGLTYDNAENGLSAVVSGSYRSFLFEKFEGGLPIWEGSQFHLGVSASYDITNSLSTSLSLNNLTNQPNEEIEFKPSKDRSRKHEQEWYSWWGTLSVTYELF